VKKALALLELPDLGGKNGSDVLSQKLWAVVEYTDAMTRDVAVKDGVFEKLRQHFSEQEIVEVTATVSAILKSAFDTRQIVGKCMLIHMLQVAAYNCVSRFLVALDGKLLCHSRTTIRC
jgi:hypothetical protein